MTHPTLERMRAALRELIHVHRSTYELSPEGRAYLAEIDELLAAPIPQSHDIGTCSYFCDRPECIKAQRDELRGMFEKANATQPAAAVAEGGMPEPTAYEVMAYGRRQKLVTRADVADELVAQYRENDPTAEVKYLLPAKEVRTYAAAKDERIRALEARIEQLTGRSFSDRMYPAMEAKLADAKEQIAELSRRLEAAEKDAAGYRAMRTVAAMERDQQRPYADLLDSFHDARTPIPEATFDIAIQALAEALTKQEGA
jgi:hypothetical protein